MLRASNVDAVDNIISFFGVLVDIFSGLCNTDEVASAVVTYVDILNFVFKHHMNFKRITESMQHLEPPFQLPKKKAWLTF